MFLFSISLLLVKAKYFNKLLITWSCIATSLYQFCEGSWVHAGADLGFPEEEAKPSSGSLKQGFWGAVPPEAIGCWVFEVPKSKV